MDRVGAAFLGHADDLVDRKIRRDRPQPLADPVGLVGLEAVQGKLVLFGKDRDRALADLVGGAHHADGDLTPVGDEDLLEFGHLVPLRPFDATMTIAGKGSTATHRCMHRDTRLAAPDRCTAAGLSIPAGARPRGRASDLCAAGLAACRGSSRQAAPCSPSDRRSGYAPDGRVRGPAPGPPGHSARPGPASRNRRPDAIARRMSSPPSTPLSKISGRRVAARICGSTSIVAGAASNCRPAWFETQIASTPACSSFGVDRRVSTPLTISGPSQCIAQPLEIVPVGRGAQQVAHMRRRWQVALLLARVVVEHPHVRHARRWHMPSAQAGPQRHLRQQPRRQLGRLRAAPSGSGVRAARRRARRRSAPAR